MKTYYENAGKGDHARVRDVSAETYSNNWEAIFGNKQKNSGCSTESEPSQEDIPVGE